MEKPKPRNKTYYPYEDIETYLCEKYGFDMDDRESSTVPKYKNSFWLEVICDRPGMCNGSYITLYRDEFDDSKYSDDIKKIGRVLFQEFSNGEDKIELYVGW